MLVGVARLAAYEDMKSWASSLSCRVEAPQIPSQVATIPQYTAMPVPLTHDTVPKPDVPLDFPRPTGLLVIVSPQTVLKSRAPQRATIIVDRRSGKIEQVLEGQLLKQDEDAGHPALQGAKEVEWIVLPEGKVLMPGLVE